MKLTINGVSVEVDDSFAKLSPEQQEATVDEIAASLGAQQPSPNVAVDVVKSGATGLAEGAIGIPGMIGDVQEALGGAGAWVAEKLGAGAETQGTVRESLRGVGPFGRGLSSQEIKGVIGFEGHAPETTAGKYARTVGQFVPAAALGGPGAAVRYGVVPGLASEAAGQATEGSAVEPYARVGAALAAPAGAGALRRAVSPMPQSAQHRQAVQTLRREGVRDLSPAEIAGSEQLRRFEIQRGGNRTRNLSQRAKEQFTAAALRRAGIQGHSRATADVMDDAATRFSRDFDAFAANNRFGVDGRTVREAAVAAREYIDTVAPSLRSPQVERFLRDMMDMARLGRPMPGSRLTDMQSKLGARAAQAARSGDGALAVALFGMQEAIHGAIQRSLPRNAMRDWQRLRQQYRHYLLLIKAMSRAGKDTADGLLSPQQLRSVAATAGNKAYVRGRGPYADLARAGESVMRPPNSSGTAENLAALKSPAAYLAGFDWLPSVAAHGMMSAPGRAYMTNNILPPPPPMNRALQIYGGTLPLRLPQE